MARPRPRPKVTSEVTNHGYLFLDCPVCGTLGVWPDRQLAKRVKTEHVCGQPDTVPGKIGTRIIIGPPPGGM